MKRNVWAIALAGIVAASVLGGCGQSTTSDNQKDSTVSGSDTTQDTVQSADENTGNTAEVEDISLTLTTTYSETEYAGKLVKHFVDYLKEKSGDKVNIEVFWGGTLAGNGEELSFVGTDAADMSIIGQSTYTDVLSLLNFPSQVSGGYENAVEFMDYIVFENEQTAPLIEAQTTAQNVKMLGSTAAGSNAFLAKKEYQTLDELNKTKLGVGMNQSAFEELGFSVVTVMPWDYYDSLSRGIIDTGYMSISALVSMSIQEVTPYFIGDGTYTAGNFFTINLDKWNGMSDAAKSLFEEAMADTQKYSVDLSNQSDDESEAAIVAAGGSMIQLTGDDQKAVQETLFKTGVSDARSYAQTAGCTEDMETVLSAVSEYLNIPLE